MQAPFRRLSSVVRGQSSAVSNETIWALKDVSFEACPELSRRVQRGEVVGIIGRNGAGKTEKGRGKREDGFHPPISILQSPLSIFTEPTEGAPRRWRAEIHGRVGSLLEAVP